VDSLRQIAERYGTDKAVDVEQRSFIRVYELLLEHRRLDELRLLEIGVFEGASLRTWRDYLPNTAIAGADINPSAAELRSEGFTIFIGDQADPGFLADLAANGPYDVVIDDGSHRSEHQIMTLRSIWPVVAPGGVYVIEDIHTSYLGNWGGGYKRQGTLVEEAKSLIDDPNAWWHQQPPVLQAVESVQVWPELLVVMKQAVPFRGGGRPDPRRLDELNRPG
jgi:hypothetical protein